MAVGLFDIKKSQKFNVVTQASGQEYTVVSKNISNVLPNITFFDFIPMGMTYTPGSFKVDGVTQTPAFAGNSLSYSIPSWPVGVTHTFSFSTTVVPPLSASYPNIGYVAIGNIAEGSNQVVSTGIPVIHPPCYDFNSDGCDSIQKCATCPIRTWCRLTVL